MSVVVKLGGSLFRDAKSLKVVCDQLLLVPGRVVVVPGGGAFADGVRAAQVKFQFDDETAHLMAILGMEQNGYLLLSLLERSVPAPSLDQFELAWAQGSVPVWMPFAVCQDDKVLPKNWSVTSDAIAARLAERIEARGIVLLKACEISPSLTVQQMQESGVVDKVFGDIVERSGLRSRVLGPSRVSDLRGVVADLDECST